MNNTSVKILDSEKGRLFVWPDLGPNILQMLTADVKS